MKHLKPILAVAVVMLAMAMPSISAAQYHEERLDNFLSNHPGVRADLERNPNLIYDRRFREQHAELETFLQNHPGVWGKLRDSGRWGAYGPDHNWHEADWWHEHDPNWANKNHPEWAENHPDWNKSRAVAAPAEGRQGTAKPESQATAGQRQKHDHRGDHY